MLIDNFKKIAVLIDADNAQAARMEDILKDISTYGRIITKRAYANWTKQQLKPWENVVKKFAIGTIQQFDFVSGKNASDMALTIDAMDLLHTGNYDCFVIVSSDSDFTSLSMKLHESGALVVGYGNKQTVESFRNACDEFNYVEDLIQDDEKSSRIRESTDKYNVDNEQYSEKKNENNFLNTNTTSSLCIDNSEISIDKLAEESNSKNQYENPQDEEFFDKSDIFLEEELDSLLKKAEEKYAEDDGFVYVSSAGIYIKRVRSDFNINTLGYKKLSEYIKEKSDKYEVTERQVDEVHKQLLYRSKA